MTTQTTGTEASRPVVAVEKIAEALWDDYRVNQRSLTISITRWSGLAEDSPAKIKHRRQARVVQSLFATPTPPTAPDSPQVREALDDAIRVPLHELQADVDYLFGRVMQDHNCAPQMAASVKAKLTIIEQGVVAALASPAPSVPARGEEKPEQIIARLEKELGVTGTANVFREAQRQAKAAAALSRLGSLASIAHHDMHGDMEDDDAPDVVDELVQTVQAALVVPTPAPGETTPPAQTGEAQTASGDDEPDDLKWLRYQVLALCEDTEAKYAEVAQSDLNEKQGAFARGRITEAKSIRRAIAEVVRCRLADRQTADAQTQEGGR